MSYVFMVIHRPKPEHREDLLNGMREMALLMGGRPGFVEAGPWEDEGSDRIIGISRWTSKDAFLAAVPPGVGTPSSDVHPWETHPRDLFHLHDRPA